MLGTSGHVVTLHMFVYKCSPVQLKYLFETMFCLFLVNKNKLNLSDNKVMGPLQLPGHMTTIFLKIFYINLT